jgi:hypothetical protein
LISKVPLTRTFLAPSEAISVTSGSVSCILVMDDPRIPDLKCEEELPEEDDEYDDYSHDEIDG